MFLKTSFTALVFLVVAVLGVVHNIPGTLNEFRTKAKAAEDAPVGEYALYEQMGGKPYTVTYDQR